MEFYQVKDYSANAFKRSYGRSAYLKLRGKIKSIAVYKSGGGLGDLVQSIPFFRSFRKMFPGVQITYIGLYQRPRCDTLFDNIPYIDEYIEYVRPGRERSFRQYYRFLKQFSGKFDLIVDTQPKFAPSFYLWLLKPKYFLSRNLFFSHWRIILNPGTKVHIAAKMLSLVRALGLKEIDLSPGIEMPEKYLSLAKEYMKAITGRLISILPGAGHPYKMWPKEKFASLGDRFYAMGYKVMLIGAESERELLLEVAGMMKNKPIIPLADEARFGQDPVYSIGLFKSSALTVGCDCGGLHLASLAGCPVIGIYGPTNPIKSGPLGEKNAVIYRGLGCSPCRLRDCKLLRRCLEEITPEEVIKAANLILGTPFYPKQGHPFS
ncbi:glycosyltransferase family 9 protein [Candidatus Omnitrophota bacterium]